MVDVVAIIDAVANIEFRPYKQSNGLELHGIGDVNYSNSAAAKHP